MPYATRYAKSLHSGAQRTACSNIADLPFFRQDHECGREHENDREHRERIAKAQDQRLPSNDLSESDKSLMVCCSRGDAAMRREVAGRCAMRSRTGSLNSVTELPMMFD
jgi:hypothetical protein